MITCKNQRIMEQTSNNAEHNMTDKIIGEEILKEEVNHGDAVGMKKK